MNWLKKGPELKLANLKVPDFLYDLFYDLRERHLLPLVALLIVAMIGAPIYLKSSKDSEPAVTAAPPTQQPATGSGKALVVARSEPGLRDYRRRLQKFRALDPFRKRNGGAPSAGAETAEAKATTTVAPAEATIVGEEAGGASQAPPSIAVEPSTPSTTSVPDEFPSSSPEPSSSAGSGKTAARYASDTIDVRIVTVPHSSTDDRKAKRSKPVAKVRRDLPELTMLPARNVPAATYIGLSNDGKKALFVVSSDVESIFGEGKCVIGSQSCQMLALEPGLPETFVYGPQERTYRIELMKIEESYAAKPRRAALGSTAGNGKHGVGEAAEGDGTGTTPAPRTGSSTGTEPADTEG